MHEQVQMAMTVQEQVQVEVQFTLLSGVFSNRLMAGTLSPTATGAMALGWLVSETIDTLLVFNFKYDMHQ